MDWAVPAEITRASVPGVVMAVVSREGAVWAKGYGMTRAGGAPVGTATPLRVGSVSKTVTAALVLSYAAEGRLALDRPVAATLPAFARPDRFGSGTAITPRMLLAHHSGLPSDPSRGMWSAQPAALAESAALAGRSWLAAPPGTTYKYSNLDYGVLGRLAETAARDLLHPLGMAASSFAGPVGEPELPHRKGARAGDRAARGVGRGPVVLGRRPRPIPAGPHVRPVVRYFATHNAAVEISDDLHNVPYRLERLMPRGKSVARRRPALPRSRGQLAHDRSWDEAAAYFRTLAD